MLYTTRQAAAALGIALGDLQSLIRTGKITPPHADASGRFIWQKGQMSAARHVVTARARRKAKKAAK
jgi:predicted site-specific integrase-resolvase